MAWDVHRGLSGLEERFLTIPGADRLEVWKAMPRMGLLRAEILLESGHPVEARRVLEQTPADCLQYAVLNLAIVRGMNEDESDAMAAIEACDVPEPVMRNALWSSGFITQ